MFLMNLYAKVCLFCSYKLVRNEHWHIGAYLSAMFLTHLPSVQVVASVVSSDVSLLILCNLLFILILIVLDFPSLSGGHVAGGVQKVMLRGTPLDVLCDMLPVFEPVERLVCLSNEGPQGVGLAMLAASTASLMCALKGITLDRQHEIHFLTAE